MARIVHISDIHFGTGHKTGVDAKPAAKMFEEHFVVSPTNYILDALRDLNPKADLIFITGDYVTGADAS